MGPKGPVLWVTLFSCVWTISLAGYGGLRLPVPTSETIALVAREMGAATFEESLESLEDTGDSAVAASGRRVQRKLVTGVEDLGDNMEYQEYQGVMGRPGVDFPVLPNIPSTSFSCRAVRKPGYYADLDTDCQVFHICDGGRKISFLCPNGTIFRQSHLICDWWFRVDCGKSVELYEESAEQLAADQRIYKERAEAISKAMNKGSSVFDASREPPRRPEERPSLGPQTTSPVFETARENYETRQNFRKQNALQQRKQRVQSETQRSQTVNQQQTKSSDVSFTNQQNYEEEEQQVLSETASFAAAQGKRFGKQFYQQSVNSLNPSSVSPQSSTQSTQSQSVSFTSSTQPQTYQSSKVPSFDLKKVSFVTPSTESSVSYSSSQAESFSPEAFNEFSSSSTFSSSTTPPTPRSAQRNFKQGKSLLPTSSQNNNFRRSKGFRNRQPFESLRTKVTEGSSSFATQSTADPSLSGSSPFSTTVGESEARSSSQSSTAFLNSFSRPSIDLIPPHDANFVPKPPPSSSQNSNLQATAKINSKNINRLGRNRLANLSTRPPFESSSPNSFSSPAKASGIDDALNERRFKQRKFPSTTEKPVFTVKFRPNKSFSYVELERTSPESSTPKNVQVSSTERPQFSSSPDVEQNVPLTSSTREPNSFSSSSFPSSSFPSSSISSSSSSPSFTPSSYSGDEGDSEHFEVTETPYIEEKYLTEWTPTHSPKFGFDISDAQSSVPSAPSYSPTVPEKDSSKDSYSSSQQSGQPSTQSVGFENKDSLLDKLADFSNIDPAEINLLPSSGKKVGKENTRIPDSAGPNALHTLALYYATSESDQGTTPAFVSSNTPSNQPMDIFQNDNTNLESLAAGTEFGNKQQEENGSQQKIKVSDEILLRSHSGSPDTEAEIDEVQATVQSSDAVKDLSSVLTKATKDSFSFLFNDTKEESQTHVHADDKPCTGDDIIDLDATKETVTENAVEIKEDVRNDLESDQSRGIVQPKPTMTVAKNPFNQFSAAFDDLPDELKLRDSTDLRELAQVFSRALSAYLEDPDSFRRILSEVRPTEPSGADFATASSIDEHEDEVLDFSDASSSGPRLIPSAQNTVDREPKLNSVDVEQINDLVRIKNVSDSILSTELTAPTQQAEIFDTPLYTTVNPILFANDINLLSVDTNHTSVESLTDNTYFPTSGGVDDQSRPRYGGFQNNSISSDYKPYGAEVLNSFTGKPIAQSSFATEAPVSASSFDNSIGIEVNNKNYSTSASNQIDIESIPDQLGIVPAHDINSLVEGHNDQHISTHFHEGHFIPEDSPEIIQTEEEIYGRGSDQENLLIASGSQSLVSRDNYLRFLGSKQEHDSKSKFVVSQSPREGSTSKTESGENSQATPTIRGRGSVKFGPSIIPSPSNFKRRQNKEVTFQNVNLGNSVTLERTKSPRISIADTKPSTLVPFDTNEANFNAAHINEQLGFVREEAVVSTERPIQNVQSIRFGVRATTYHPETNRPELPDMIPPRGSLRGSWKWNSQEPNTAEQSTSTQANQESSTAFSNFVSTLLPPNVTIETAGEEMLEKKAEEIFGKLNKTSADMLMNVMNQAESNMTVRRLVLLLVADRNGRERSFEESRSQLVQALLQTSAALPESTSSLDQSTERLDKSTTNQRMPERTRGRSRSYPTVAPAASTQQTTKIPRGRGSKALRGNDSEKSSEKSTVQNERQVNPPQYLRSPNLFPSKQSTANFGADPDGRAVELLKTLYNLAARWG